jgi:hypothetical protein
MAWFKCPSSGREFRIVTEDGTRYGTNMPYIDRCPFCGCDMDGDDVLDKE